jgi:serine/threonine protein kinase
MLGGRIRGQGTYGCIFQPALKCRGNKIKNSNAPMVGKITSKQDAKNELEIAKILGSIKNSSDYVVLTEATKCIPRAKTKQVDGDIGQCNLLKENELEDTVQLMMPWGGYPLSRINLDPFVFNYFKFIEEILACGAFLVLNDLCHFDIWGNNFLFDKYNKPKLIDFGFTFQGSKLTIDDLSNRWRVLGVDHDTETPEVSLMLAVHSNIPVERIIRGLEKEKPAVQNLVSFCDVNPSHWGGELYQWSLDSHSFQQHDWLSCWKVYWPGFDAWSIGAMLLSVLEVQMGIPEFVKSKSWTEKSELIKKVLRGLCRAHPAFRLDAVEALSLLTDGKHPLISSGSAGSDWISEKQKTRPMN